MIFILHYLLFNAGLPAVIMLMSLFLQTYSAASMTEIGTLLMALPFVSILIKPLFCALADRQQAHQRYLIVALALMAAGYGSLVLAPFFPAFVEQNGRLVWYLDILGIIIGYSAFALVWSLGDALAVNHAQMSGLTWATYRVWGVVSWGAGGILIGQINELPQLPRYVPAFFVLILSLLLEICLLLVWPKKHFVMGGSLEVADDDGDKFKKPAALEQKQSAFSNASGLCKTNGLDDSWSLAGAGQGTPSGSARADPRMVGALANMVLADLRSSLRLSSQRGASLDEALDEVPRRLGGSVRNSSGNSRSPSVQPTSSSLRLVKPPKGSTPPNPLPCPACSSPKPTPPSAMVAPGAGRQPTGSAQAQTQPQPQTPRKRNPTLRRTQQALARMNSLSAMSGHVIADEPPPEPGSPMSRQDSILSKGSPSDPSTPARRQAAMYMSSLASQVSSAKALAAARSLGLDSNSKFHSNDDSPLNQPSGGDLQLKPLDKGNNGDEAQRQQAGEWRSADELQLVLLKLIIRHDRAIWKYLLVFTVFGAMLICHLSYFFLHLEQLCRAKGADFSLVTGGMMAAHSVSEVFSFTIVVPHYVPRVGRCGALMSCALIYAIRFAYYGTLLESHSPYTGIPFELAHGIAYGIVYSLITDIACECVNQVDLHLPELIKRGLVEPGLEPSQLKLQLRATMQGLFSGAFDGLGNGLGALFGGLFLDAYSFAHLWRCCLYVCLATLALYPLTEWRALVALAKRHSKPKAQQQQPAKA